ncbi:C-signal-like isoform 1-T3 [Morphnus guianensis]
MGELHVRSLLVTGANRGIGLELVRQFLGMPSPPTWVFAACRDPKGQRAQELLNLASKHPNLVIIPLEVTDPASIKAAAARVGEHLGGSGLNLLINNAGIAKASSLDNETLENMTQIYTTNTVGPLLLGQAFLPLLKKAAQGSPGSALNCSKAAIINMSSSAGSIEEVFLWNYGQVVSYRCSKAALNMLTKCQSLGYRDHGVLCAALHPGWVQTNMGGSGSQKVRELLARVWKNLFICEGRACCGLNSPRHAGLWGNSLADTLSWRRMREGETGNSSCPVLASPHSLQRPPSPEQ